MNFLNWLKEMFWIRFHQPEVVEPVVIRFATRGDVNLMTIEGMEEKLLPAGEYSVIRTENPYGQKEDWLLVVGTDLGAAISNWGDFEENGKIVIVS